MPVEGRTELGIIVGLLGLHVLGALYLFRLYLRRSRFYSASEVAHGVVIGSRKFSAGEGPEFFARISYTVAGTDYMLKGGLWSSRRYKRGESVKLRYLPESPGEASVEQRWEPALYLVCSFIFLFPIGICSWLIARAL
jgi:uncharacterized protein DUF3592